MITTVSITQKAMHAAGTSKQHGRAKAAELRRIHKTTTRVISGIRIHRSGMHVPSAWPSASMERHLCRKPLADAKTLHDFCVSCHLQHQALQSQRAPAARAHSSMVTAELLPHSKQHTGLLPEQAIALREERTCYPMLQAMLKLCPHLQGVERQVGAQRDPGVLEYVRHGDAGGGVLLQQAGQQVPQLWGDLWGGWKPEGFMLDGVVQLHHRLRLERDGPCTCTISATCIGEMVSMMRNGVLTAMGGTPESS